MAKKEFKKVKKLSSEESFRLLANAFSEASKITFSLVFFPIVILLFGVWLDKKFLTIPLFIVISIVIGVLVGIYQATRVNLKVKNFKNG